MPIEVTPTKVDDLNPAWPPADDPALEGHLHLQNIKTAVQARADVNGIHGVTTLSSATDSDLETVAATSKAVKTLADSIAGSTVTQDLADLQTLIDDLEAQVASLNFPTPGVITATAGATVVGRGSAQTARGGNDPLYPAWGVNVFATGTIRIIFTRVASNYTYNLTIDKNGAEIESAFAVDGNTAFDISVALGDRLLIEITTVATLGTLEVQVDLGASESKLVGAIMAQ